MDELQPQATSLDPVQWALAKTSARVLVGRSGPAYRTATSLQLREDHAAARDAVQAEMDLHSSFDREWIERFDLFEVVTCVTSKQEYLSRPSWGRRFSEASRQQIRETGSMAADLQVVLGDGLSATATQTQAPALLAGLYEAAHARGWSWGRPFLIRFARVGVLNDIGDLLAPKVAVLLIGERPGLATAESLSAYLAFRPRSGHTDANRNLISNIHASGIDHESAVQRIIALAERFHELQTSGVGVTI